MSRRVHASSTSGGQRALAGFTLACACTLAGSWLSFVWPRPEAHAALPARSAGPMSQGWPPGAADVEPHQVLAEFETRAAAPDVRVQRARQLAAARIHGLTLAPSEVFDWNARVPSWPSDSLDQLASTLHAAAFFAGLPILERAPQARPSFYIKLGLEAAVRPGQQNLRFRNDRSFPVLFELEQAAGAVRARVRGAARELRVTLIRDVLPTAPMPEHSELDPSLPRGMRVLTRRGNPGFSVRVQRALHDEARRRSVYEHSTLHYPATEQLWRIGMVQTAAPGFVRPRNDARPEFVTDAHLEMTQHEPGSYDVARDVGRTGSYGWTAREGFVVRSARRE